MNAVDGSDHYSKTSDGKHDMEGRGLVPALTYVPEAPASLLTIVLDTNPHAWALLAPTLPLSAAIANLLVFINAHLATNNANTVAIIASHTQQAEFLYPAPSSSKNIQTNTNGTIQNGTDEDTEMADSSRSSSPTQPDIADANHYRPFQQIQRILLTSLQSLLSSTSPDSLTPTTSIAGALTLALTFINKQTLLSSSPAAQQKSAAPSSADPTSSTSPSLISRILVLSVSGDLAHQYIPIMNTIFACQRLNIPIDICKIAGDTVFLQQASDSTKGTYIKLEHPKGLLQYLMMAFLPDQTARKMLNAPTAATVDFRAACFCHRKVVDVGFVCSICLSTICLTCGTHLKLGDYGAKPAVMVKRKKKKNKEKEKEKEKV
ncbi:uncharacterized protein KY384_007871 [Bacidia gigantensis]|uniref:uncharacterized protein n=1 Tax=Bacidia gigantensis TaxID=2732470 RepID=UPI001D059748|nr:uncharacterized protein KY384_007871 [Bacidia gigantensis]KAG8527717.1 hypothetical protein KY384_007871 [Bacidia gigantensis]